jgi:hypothetical protein
MEYTSFDDINHTWRNVEDKDESSGTWKDVDKFSRKDELDDVTLVDNGSLRPLTKAEINYVLERLKNKSYAEFRKVVDTLELSPTKGLLIPESSGGTVRRIRRKKNKSSRRRGRCRRPRRSYKRKNKKGV